MTYQNDKERLQHVVYLTRKQKITLMIQSLAREFAEKLKDEFPADNDHSYDECYEIFHLQLNIFLTQNKNYTKLDDSNVVFGLFCSDTSCTLEVEYYKEFGIIVVYFRYYYSGKYYYRIELCRFKFNEYRRAIVFCEKINSLIQSEIQELLPILDAIQLKKMNPKTFDIAVSSIRAICSSKSEELWIYSFFSEIEAYVLVSLDGTNAFLIEMLLSESSTKMKDLLRLCESPHPFVSDDKTMTCIKLYKNTKQELIQAFEHTDVYEKELEFWGCF